MSGAEIFFSFEGKEQRLTLEPNQSYGIGRGVNNPICIPSDTVSRDHALIRQNETGQFCLIDLGSRNGTLVNERLLAGSAQLRHGDAITIGKATLHFRQEAAAPSPLAGDLCASTNLVTDIIEITILVVDIRGFTGLTQTLGEQKLADVVGSFNREAGAFLDRMGVFSKKFIGDAVMAVWLNRSYQYRETLLKAFEGALEMRRIVARLESEKAVPVRLGVGAGINIGPASVGNVGSGSTADHTALGDSVNKAFRLEAATRGLESDLVFATEVHRMLRGTTALDRFATPHRIALKGYTDAIDVYAMSAQALAGFLQSEAEKSAPARVQTVAGV